MVNDNYRIFTILVNNIMNNDNYRIFTISNSDGIGSLKIKYHILVHGKHSYNVIYEEN